MEEETEIDGRIDMDRRHKGKGGKLNGKRPCRNVLWKRDGVKLKNLRVGPKALQALLHNCASPMKARCKNN